MNRAVNVIFLIALFGTLVFGQSTDNYAKNEFFVGAMAQKVNTENSRTPLSRETGLGFQVSYVRNVSKFVGIKGDFSRVHSNVSNKTIVAAAPNYTISANEDRTVYNFLAGIEFKDINLMVESSHYSTP